MKLLVKAPAKINISLDVLHKREDSYHEVEMVMTTIDLADRIELSLREDKGIKVLTHNKIVPDDNRNLAYQAAQLLQKKFSVEKGVNIRIEKNIPIAAGLAGGSTDAAATLRGLNKLWDLNLTLDQLAEIGAGIGSDVPFCVYGGTALASGRGEIIRKLDSPPPCWVVLARPNIGVSTADIYGNLNIKQVEHPKTETIVKAIETGDYELICNNLSNVLESVTLKMHPEVAHLKEKIKQFGADAVLMSGSGPTVFGFVRHSSRMQRICNGLRGFTDKVYAVRILGDRHTLD